MIEASEKERFYLAPEIIANKLDIDRLTLDQLEALKQLSGQSFEYKWQFKNALNRANDAWTPKAATGLNKRFNKELKSRQKYLFDSFKRPAEESG